METDIYVRKRKKLVRIHKKSVGDVRMSFKRIKNYSVFLQNQPDLFMSNNDDRKNGEKNWSEFTGEVKIRE